MNRIKSILTPAVRRWIYATSAAFIPLGIYLGWIEPQAAPLILAFLLAFLKVDTTSDYPDTWE